MTKAREATRAPASRQDAESRPGVYRPTEQLFLWWLAAPEHPVLVGKLRLLQATRGVSLRYTDDWVTRGFALSEDLPLLETQEFLPQERDSAAGAVDDARPDRWGERVIRFLDRPKRLSLLEYLYFAGDDRSGALGVSTSENEYQPRRLGPLPHLRDVDVIHDLVGRVLHNEPIEEGLKRLISPGVTMGGAKPKALVDIDGEAWMVKFSDGDPTDTCLVEHACMTLAARAQIHVAETRAIPLTHGHALLVRRFDRRGSARVHTLSAHVALRAAAAEPYGYAELAQLLRRRGELVRDVNRAQMRELFRRMVFNILMDNTDDHEKNHALLVSDAQTYELSPAFDVLPSAQGLGYQQMSVGELGNEATLDNALSQCTLFGLSLALARREIRKVVGAVVRWKQHFAELGVTPGDIELLAEHIDRPFLREQRELFLRR